MKCGFCQREFDPEAGVTACSGCPLAPGCHLVRCPHCGYEMPPEPRVIGWLRRWREPAKPASTTRKNEEFS
jgi:hypothetical protein